VASNSCQAQPNYAHARTRCKRISPQSNGTLHTAQVYGIPEHPQGAKPLPPEVWIFKLALTASTHAHMCPGIQRKRQRYVPTEIRKAKHCFHPFHLRPSASLLHLAPDAHKHDAAHAHTHNHVLKVNYIGRHFESPNSKHAKGKAGSPSTSDRCRVTYVCTHKGDESSPATNSKCPVHTRDTCRKRDSADCAIPYSTPEATQPACYTP
jgi:hypothetical protein